MTSEIVNIKLKIDKIIKERDDAIKEKNMALQIRNEMFLSSLPHSQSQSSSILQKYIHTLEDEKKILQMQVQTDAEMKKYLADQWTKSLQVCLCLHIYMNVSRANMQ
jgi:hypothetical protein